MCIPALIAASSIAIQVGSDIVQNNAQNKVRKESKRANAQTLADVTSAADTDYRLNAHILDTRGAQERAAADASLTQNTVNAGQVLQANRLSARQSIMASTRSAAIADGQARVSAGAAGVAGSSVDALLGDIGRTSATVQVGIGQELQIAQGNINTNLVTAQRNIRSNLAMAAEQHALELQQQVNLRQSRINAVSNLPVAPGANPWATALQIAGHVVGGAAQFIPK